MIKQFFRGLYIRDITDKLRIKVAYSRFFAALFAIVYCLVMEHLFICDYVVTNKLLRLLIVVGVRTFIAVESTTMTTGIMAVWMPFVANDAIMNISNKKAGAIKKWLLYKLLFSYCIAELLMGRGKKKYYEELDMKEDIYQAAQISARKLRKEHLRMRFPLVFFAAIILFFVFLLAAFNIKEVSI